MALNWDMTEVRDTHLLHNTAKEKGGERPFPEGSDEDWVGDRQWEITNNLIWATMAVDMGSITEKNYEEFYRRLIIAGRVFGSPYRITLADVKRRIGLGCNVTTKTATQFANRMKKVIEEDARRMLSIEKKTLANYEALLAIEDTLLEADKQELERLRVKYIEPTLEKCRQARFESARELIYSLNRLDEWTDKCDEAARIIGLDPDNYRALSNANWPEDMHNKVTFDDGAAILAHFDNGTYAKKAKA